MLKYTPPRARVKEKPVELIMALGLRLGSCLRLLIRGP